MIRMNIRNALLIVAFCAYENLISPAQTQLNLMREIKLPVQSHLGTLGGGFWVIGMTSGEAFQFKIAPDQSLLVLYPNSSSKWQLVRVRKWWTETPKIEELDLPGWSERNTRYETSIGTDLLITPDGNFAISLGGIPSVKDVRNIPSPPSDSIEHKPDLLITAVDLNRWKIIGALHTATIDDEAEFRGAYIAKGRWIALQGLDDKPERVKYEHLFDLINRLISIPELKPGPGCLTKDPEILALSRRESPESASALSQQNDAACKDLLTIAGVSSMRVFDWHIYLGDDPEPRNLMAHTQLSGLSGFSEIDKDSTKPEFIWPSDEYNHGYWTSNEWDIFEDNPPFESSANHWYQLQGQDQGINFHYQLNKYMQDGELLETRATELQSEPKCRSRLQCVCEVVDVSEQQKAILALCRAQSMNFIGSFDWHRQWAAIYRTDDLLQIGEVELKTTYTRSAIAAADGRTYMVTVEQGKILRVYSVPDH
jgi:hypothetical protein